MANDKFVQIIGNVTRDPELLRERIGQCIQWYHLRPLRRSRALEIRNNCVNDKSARSVAFMECVVAVENLRTDGGLLQQWQPGFARDTARAEGGGQMTLDELDFFPPRQVYEIGAIALVRADLARGEPVFFPPLDSSGLAILVASYLSADGNLDLDSLMRDAVAPLGMTVTPKSTETGDAESATPGDAPVEGVPDDHT